MSHLLLAALLLAVSLGIDFWATRMLIRWTPRVLDWVFARFARCKHGRRGYPGSRACNRAAKAAAAEQEERRAADAEWERGKSTYVHDPDDFFDEKKAHPDRADEDY